MYIDVSRHVLHEIWELIPYLYQECKWRGSSFTLAFLQDILQSTYSWILGLNKSEETLIGVVQGGDYEGIPIV